jgi:hypothetical protein
MTKAKTIAAGLTEAQRRAVGNLVVTNYRAAWAVGVSERTLKSLPKGVWVMSVMKGPLRGFRLTPLGLEVKRILTGDQ